MSKSLDRLTLLETFVRIADAGSISAAARDLGLSQPSASRQLAELEARFKTQLMQRTTHSLSLTASGAELLADARRLLDEWEAISEKHLEARTTPKGRLKVIAPIALGQLDLLDIVLRFQQRYPLIDLTWQLQDGDIRFSEVGCDCWIKVGPVPDTALMVEPLGQIERLVVAAPDLLDVHPKTPKALAKLPFVTLLPFEGDRIPLTHANGQQTTLAPSARMSTNSITALRKATLAGLGAAVMPRWFIATDLKQGRLVDVLPQWRAPRLALHVAFLPGRHRPRRLEAFLEMLKAEIPLIAGIEQR